MSAVGSAEFEIYHADAVGRFLAEAYGTSMRIRSDSELLFLMSQPDRPCTARWQLGEIQNCIIDPAMLARVTASAPWRRPEPIRFTSPDPRAPVAWSARSSKTASPNWGGRGGWPAR